MRGKSLPKASSADVARLKKLQRKCSDTRVITRITVLLMLVQGLLVKQVSEAIGLSRRAIEKIRQRWNRLKFKGLHDQARSGRPPRVIPALRRLIIRTVETSALRFGYAFTVWTLGRLSEHLFQRTGIRISLQRLAQILHEEGFSFGLPAHTLKGKRKEQQHRHSKKRLKFLKKGRCEPILVSASASGTSRALTSSLI